MSRQPATANPGYRREHMANSPDKRDHRVGVVLTRKDKWTETETATVKVVWGISYHQGLEVTADSPEAALEQLKDRIREDLFTDRIVLFDTPEQAQEELIRRTDAAALRIGAFNQDNRDRLRDLFSADPEDDTGREEDLMDAFDRMDEALTNVEHGTFDPEYLVPAFDRQATGACVYVPHHDPRYKRELQRDPSDIPTQLTGQNREDRHGLAADVYSAIFGERMPKLFAAALEVSRREEDPSFDEAHQNIYQVASIRRGPAETMLRTLAARLRLDLMSDGWINHLTTTRLLNYVYKALDSDAQIISLANIQAVEGLADFTRPAQEEHDRASRRMDDLRRVRRVLEETLSLDPSDGPKDTVTSEDWRNRPL